MTIFGTLKTPRGKPKPTASFTASPTSGVAPLTVVFKNTSSGSGGLTSLWDFGDGSTSTQQNPSHVYLVPGTYSVRLTVSNSQGSSSMTRSSYIRADAVPVTPPTAAFSGFPLTGDAPLTVAFTDASTDAPTLWQWNFGDGGFSTLQNPVYTFNTAGDFNITLTVSNAGGQSSATKIEYVTAPGLPPGPSPSPVPPPSPTTLSAAGTSDASWVGASTEVDQAVLVTHGGAQVAWSGAATNATALAATGTDTVAWTSKSTKAAAMAAVGVGAANWAGASSTLHQGVWTALGAATASWAAKGVPALPPVTSAPPTPQPVVVLGTQGQLTDRGETDDPINDTATYSASRTYYYGDMVTVGSAYFICVARPTQTNINAGAIVGVTPGTDATKWWPCSNFYYLDSTALPNTGQGSSDINVAGRYRYSSLAEIYDVTKGINAPSTPRYSVILGKRGQSYVGNINVALLAGGSNSLVFWGAWGPRASARPTVVFADNNPISSTAVVQAAAGGMQVRNWIIDGLAAAAATGVSLPVSAGASLVNCEVKGCSYGAFITGDNFYQRNTYVHACSIGSRVSSGSACVRLHNTFDGNTHNVSDVSLTTWTFNFNRSINAGGYGYLAQGVCTGLQANDNYFAGNINGWGMQGAAVGQTESVIGGEFRRNTTVNSSQNGMLIDIVQNVEFSDCLFSNNAAEDVKVSLSNVSGTKATPSNLRFYFNTHYCPSGSLGGYDFGANLLGIIGRNNIVHTISAGGSCVTSLVAAAQFDWDFNIYWAPNNGNLPLRWAGTNYSLAAFRAGPGASTAIDSHSLYADPLLMSPPTNLVCQPTGPGKAAGTPIPSVPLDILGAPRNTMTPTLGAYEIQHTTTGVAPTSRVTSSLLFQSQDRAFDISTLVGGSNFKIAWGPNGTHVDFQCGWPWINTGGDWIDANGTAQGTVPWASVNTPALTSGTLAEYRLDITNLAKRGTWLAMYLGTNGQRRILNRAPFSTTPPRVEVTYTDATTAVLPCTLVGGISAGLTPDTVSQFTYLPCFIEFQRPTKPVSSVVLVATIEHSNSSGGTVSVFLLNPPLNSDPVEFGVAQSASNLDVGITSAPGVMGSHRYQDGTTFGDFNFDNGTVYNVYAESLYDPVIWGGASDPTKFPTLGLGKWVYGGGDPTPPTLISSSYVGEGFTPLAPGIGAMRWHMPAQALNTGDIVGSGGTGGANHYLFMPVDKYGLQQTLYVRQYVLIGNDAYPTDWRKRLEVYKTAPTNGATWTAMNGKWGCAPIHETSYGGFSGSAGGGIGWQMRLFWGDVDGNVAGPDELGLNGGFHLFDFQGSNPPGYNYGGDEGKDTQFGQRGGYGSMFYPGQWYCLETYLKLNSVMVASPGFLPDGELRAWVNGRKVFERTGMVFRSLPLYNPGYVATALRPARELGVRAVMHNWYHGGTTQNSVPRTMFITGLVYGSQYIGPMKGL